ncbi:ABC transporter ATP-binding protein [Candidatus Symbiopectobacterium sp. NZEC135]|uniref:ABC transporter ATP-binding protein n=1 Tax=Candidatus Symbiopectobacterium sp. NZEC135 TaxID=2820471 RepID=UPI0022272737|nr:dipeptide/oligopeptide/nickel ABC transporter ATP-binding protein [Candidatus Symbiopectobacterium sp. NZEC135]MCW2479641.1 ABC transporter ATP-binding protein [Candidatus Symbiopectobacterium sp. NZEC135]
MSVWLEARDLSQRYQLRATGEWQAALQSVSFSIARGECVGIVGASGSGKSTLGRVLLGLERPEVGEVILAGTSLYEKSGLWRRGIGNGGRVGAVFQDYASSVNPLMCITDIVAEPLRLQRRLGRMAARERAGALLHQVGLDDTLGIRYPHQLSGGQMQRVCIARAIACEPELVVLDEAVSALDVAVQRQILDLLAELRQRLGLTYLFISHDLTAVTYLCQRVLFLHQGRVIEQVNDMAALGHVQHPAARRLLTSVMAF